VNGAAASGAPALETDGRRRRAIDSRARIIAAMIDLTAAGGVSVSAEQVAQRADVGLRSVFRHFNDMDSLYREMSKTVEARIVPIVEQPFSSEDWRGRLEEVIARRAQVFEMIAPFRRAEAAHRHRSRFLEEDTSAFNQRARTVLTAILPPALVADGPRFEALDLLLSFEAWDRLRRDQGLDPQRARDTLAAAAFAIVAPFEGLPRPGAGPDRGV
jgi:AcrR family transcriptional regulator